jgi:hypothetical protein
MAGEIAYWAPDSLRWEPLGLDHGAFVQWVLSEGSTEFYEPWRWSGWAGEVAEINGHHGLSLYPPPFTSEGRNLDSVQRRAVPWAELVAFQDDMARQLNGE